MSLSRSSNNALVFVVASLLGIVAIVTGFYLKAGTAVVGYGLIALVVAAFALYPKTAILVSLAAKPIIDLFWWTKGEGLLSPLFIAGVAVPILGLVAARRVAGRSIRRQEDMVVLLYLAVFLCLALARAVASPQYLGNSIQSFAKLASVTSFYFIGKYYFTSREDRRHLLYALLLSGVGPFVLTMGQKLLGWNVTNFDEVIATAGRGVDTGLVSGFYITGRYGAQRISGAYEGVYTLAFLGVFVLLMLLTARLSRDFAFKPYWYGLLGLAGYFVYATYSRSAWVTLGTTLLVLFLLRREPRRAIVVVAAAAAVYFLVEGVRLRFADELGALTGGGEFTDVGRGRGGKWMTLLPVFFRRDLIDQLVGTFGVGNPENQFLNALFFSGYLGFMAMLGMMIYFTVRLVKRLRSMDRDASLDTNAMLTFGSLIVACYWFAGWGNNFPLMISVQWVLWTWTGVIVGNTVASRHRVADVRRAARPAPMRPAPVASSRAAPPL